MQDTDKNAAIKPLSGWWGPLWGAHDACATPVSMETHCDSPIPVSHAKIPLKPYFIWASALKWWLIWHGGFEGCLWAWTGCVAETVLRPAFCSLPVQIVPLLAHAIRGLWRTELNLGAAHQVWCTCPTFAALFGSVLSQTCKCRFGEARSKNPVLYNSNIVFTTVFPVLNTRKDWNPPPALSLNTSVKL